MVTIGFTTEYIRPIESPVLAGAAVTNPDTFREMSGPESKTAVSNTSIKCRHDAVGSAACPDRPPSGYRDGVALARDRRALTGTPGGGLGMTSSFLPGRRAP